MTDARELNWRDKVRFWDADDPTADAYKEGEVIGVNHINVMIRFGPGPNDVRLVSIRKAKRYDIQVTERYEPMARRTNGDGNPPN